MCESSILGCQYAIMMFMIATQIGLHFCFHQKGRSAELKSIRFFEIRIRSICAKILGITYIVKVRDIFPAVIVAMGFDFPVFAKYIAACGPAHFSANFLDTLVQEMLHSAIATIVRKTMLISKYATTECESKSFKGKEFESQGL